VGFAIGFADLCGAGLCSCGLTFELSGRRRQDARPGPVKMYRVPPDRAWWPAVGAPLERGVRRHRGSSQSDDGGPELDLWPVESAELVAVWISDIGKMERAWGGVPLARRFLDRGSAVRYCSVMKCPEYLWGAALEPNRSTVGRGGRFAVDGLSDAESRSFMPIEQPLVASVCSVPDRLAYA